MPSKKEEDEVSVNKLDEVKVVVNLINQWTFRSPAEGGNLDEKAEGKGKRIRDDKDINPQKAFEVRLRLFFENLLWILFYSPGSETLMLKYGG